MKHRPPTPHFPTFLHDPFLSYPSSADWDQCAEDTKNRVQGQPVPSLYATAPSSPDLSDCSDADSDPGGGDPVTPTSSGRRDDRDGDEETGTRGYYEGDELVMVRETSGGGRAELDVGESSGLVAAAAAVPRRSGSGGSSGGGGGSYGSDIDSVDGLMEMDAAGEKSRLVPEAAAAARRDGNGIGGFDLIV